MGEICELSVVLDCLEHVSRFRYPMVSRLNFRRDGAVELKANSREEDPIITYLRINRELRKL